MSSTHERVLSFPDALAEVLHHAQELQPPNQTQNVALAEAAGRVLAAPIRAERDQPPFDRSTRDGYAVRAADLANGRALRLVGSLRAGEAPTVPPIGAGQALEIMTGAPVPPMADAVLMFEHAELSGETVRMAPGRKLSSGENVVQRGAEARAGQEIVPAGRRLAPPEIALAASCGLAELPVFARPRVAIVATGDELVELGSGPEPWQIRNSNSYALVALVREAGGHPRQLAIARDTREDLETRLQQAADADLLLISGGVSAGKYDLVEEVLAHHGAEFFFTGTLIQPGKPLVFGRLPRDREKGSGNREKGFVEHQEAGCPRSGFSDLGLQDACETYFFGLPGNPVSTEVCFRMFVAPLLHGLAGQSELGPRFVEARLTEDVRGGARVTRFLPAFLSSDWQSASVELVPWQGSGDLAANARANCFAVLPAEAPGFSAGETIRVLLR